jgi:arabinofuranan 3-O-arabinosyltransferase
MPRPHRDTAVAAALGLVAYALAFVQRPGFATSDTKIDLHVAAGRFLADVSSMWSDSGSLGQAQGGQTAGYLFPMGPFFALGDLLGLAPWVVQRLWLGTLLALGAWGTVRLLDALLTRRRGVAHLVAGLLVIVNPFVVVYANRTTVTLLATALLPWLMLAAHRGARAPGWRWPAAFALLVIASGAGINAAVTALMLVGPALLLVYEAVYAGVPWRAVRAFVLRAAPLTLLVSLWWLIPAWVQASYGTDFLPFTESSGTIWATTSASESLRLMGFWVSYLGVDYTMPLATWTDARTLLYAPAVVAATLLVPALALAGFTWTRRWRYGPFFLGLVLLGLLVMVAGFPDGTPLRRGLTYAYNHFPSLRVLRTTYKAGPLVALGIACLAGVAAGEAWRRLGSARRPAALRAALVAAGLALIALAGWPLVTGRAQDPQISWREIPRAWTAAMRDLDRELPASSRALVLPGDLFDFHTWGGTVDSLAPALSRRPVAERSFTPYADLRTTDLHWTVDALIQQRRLLPGQLAPLLSLLGVRSVITPADDDPARGGGPYPGDVEALLAAQPGVSRPDRSYGPLRPAARGPDELGASVALPQVRRYDLPRARPLVRVESRGRPLIVDGSAQTLVAASAFGTPAPGQVLRYAADLPAGELRRLASRGADLVVGDSNRRRAFVAASLVQNAGPTLPPDQAPAENGVILDPFGDGAPAQTVAVLHGARSIEAPYSPTIPQFPEHRPFAAFDGDPDTAWLADRTLDPARRRLDLTFTRPRDVPYVELVPYSDSRGTVRAVEIAGKRVRVRAGINRIDLGLRAVGGLSVRLAEVEHPPNGVRGAGGIAELRVPGLRLREELSLPRVSARALAGLGLERSSLTYVFTRTSGDDPHRRQLAHGPWSARDVRDRGDAERELRRVFTLPATRGFRADAWVTVAADAPDDELDALAGYRGRVRADSSSRYQARPAWRASSALDDDTASAWIGGWMRGERTWIRWRAPEAQTVRALRLAAPSEHVRRPTVVRLRWGGEGVSPRLRVSPTGEVTLPRSVRARAFELEVLQAAFAPDVPSARRRNRAVGIAEIEGVEGLPAVRGARGSLSGRCGALSVRLGGQTLDMRVTAARAAFEAGRPLRARPCGPAVQVPAGALRLSTTSGEFAIDSLRLNSPAAAPALSAGGRGGRVLDTGTPGRGRLDGVRLRVDDPSWLVLGEGYNRGWRAWCGDRELGAPKPVDGYANGWRVGSGCRSAHFAFALNRSARLGYAVSLLACLACLALVVVDPRRRAGPAAAVEAGELPGADAVERVSPRRAGAVALVCGAIIAFIFGPVAGAVALVPIFVALLMAVGARALTLAGAALLVFAVPLLYLVHPADPDRANNVPYPAERIGAHWVTVAALILLFGALLRTLVAARGDRLRPDRTAAMLARSHAPERLHAPGDRPTHGAGR